MFINKNIVPVVKELLESYHRILENAITDRVVYLSGQDQIRLTAIRKELAQMGLVLSVIVSKTHPENFVVTVKGPHLNMTPEEIRNYDRWFLETNGIDPDRVKNF